MSETIKVRNRIAGLDITQGFHLVYPKRRAIISVGREALQAAAPEKQLLRKEERTPENAVKLLRENRFTGAKIFCRHSSDDEVFIVKSRMFDWEITRLKDSKTEVPAVILEGVHLLLSNGFEIQRLFLGKPKRQMFGEILAREVIAQTRPVRKTLKPVTKYLPDPVLLVQLKGHDNLVEVARWI